MSPPSLFPLDDLLSHDPHAQQATLGLSQTLILHTHSPGSPSRSTLSQHSGSTRQDWAPETHQLPPLLCASGDLALLPPGSPRSFHFPSSILLHISAPPTCLPGWETCSLHHGPYMNPACTTASPHLGTVFPSRVGSELSDHMWKQPCL